VTEGGGGERRGWRVTSPGALDLDVSFAINSRIPFGNVTFSEL
jgi:hypothetical protein